MNNHILKKQKKWTSVLVTVTFAWLLMAPATPMRAGDKIEAACSGSFEQAPGFYEQPGPDWSRRVRTKTVLIILGVLLFIGIMEALINGLGREAAPRRDERFGTSKHPCTNITFFPIRFSQILMLSKIGYINGNNVQLIELKSS